MTRSRVKNDFSTGIDDNATSTAVTIESGGNVGIGTTNPSGIGGGADLAVTKSGGARFILNNSSRQWAIRGDSGIDDLRITARGSSDTVDVDYLTVASTGNVGIGVDPSYNLDVGSTTDAIIRLRTSGTGSSDDTFLRMQVGSTDADNWVYFGDADDSNAGQIGYQHGSDRFRVFTNATEALRINNDQSLQTYGGITFSGTATASNALDDYEEGTWTPVLEADTTSPTVTYASQYGIYTKIGDVVTVSFRTRTSAISGGSGILRINGLPFAPRAGNYQVGAVGYSTGWTNAPSAVYTQLNYGYMRLSRYNASGVSLLQTTDLNYSSANDIIASVTYKT